MFRNVLRHLEGKTITVLVNVENKTKNDVILLSALENHLEVDYLTTRVYTDHAKLVKPYECKHKLSELFSHQ